MDKLQLLSDQLTILSRDAAVASGCLIDKELRALVARLLSAAIRALVDEEVGEDGSTGRC